MEFASTAAIIPAGGSGKRMGTDQAKQYLPLRGIPILARTLTVFQACRAVHEIFLVVPREDIPFVQEQIITPFALQKVCRILPGGKERQDSVQRGLDAVGPEHRVVVIHDGVRPFVPEGLLHQVIAMASAGICVTAGMPAKDTVKTVDEAGWIRQTLPRAEVWLTQTPQAFPREVIQRAYREATRAQFTGTDDASLVERLGIPVRMIPGPETNFKITTWDDWMRAQSFLADQPPLPTP